MTKLEKRSSMVLSFEGFLSKDTYLLVTQSSRDQKVFTPQVGLQILLRLKGDVNYCTMQKSRAICA
jgi:hypothetical protein